MISVYYLQAISAATSGGPLYSSDTPPYLYSGNEQEKLNGLNQYDFHARWLDNAVPRFTTQDPLAEAHYDESPYVYCGNDPVNKVDPLGLDWYYNDPNEFPTYIEGNKDNKNYKYHSKTAYRESANLRYYFGEAGSIMIVEKVTGDAMTYLPQTVVKPSGGGYTNYNSYSYGSLNEMMGEGGRGGACENCLDQSTVGHNLLWLSYPGGNNPRTYSGKYTYSYVPSRLSEYPAIGHDRRYDNLDIAGAKGLLTDARAIGADWRFVAEELSIAGNQFVDPVSRIQAGLLGAGLGILALPKTMGGVFQSNGLISLSGIVNIVGWYNISNAGVTNTPSTHSH